MRIQAHLHGAVWSTIEETLNALLDGEQGRLFGAKRYDGSEARMDTRACSYDGKLQTKAGEVMPNVSKLRNLPFESAIIDR